jgi:predicted nucleic acid-binding protein
VSYSTEDRLAVFLYLLVRDHVPFGEVMEAVEAVERAPSHELTNVPVAAWAVEVSRRIRVP